MAFNLQNYVQGNFNVGKDPASIRAAAQEILDNKDVFGAVGNQAPVTWAQSAIGYLEKYERLLKGVGAAGNVALQKQIDTALSKAGEWITGTAQSHAAKNYKEKYTKRVADLKKDIANKASNIANTLDIPANATAADRAALEKRAAAMQAELSALSPQAQALGIDIPASSGLVKTAGGYIPASDQTAAQRAQQQEADAMAKANGQPVAAGGSTSISMAVEPNTQTGAASTPSYKYGPDVLDKKANDSAVNHLYQQYFQRDATRAELDNWGAKGGADTTVRALEDFLKAEKVKYGTPITTADVPNTDSGVLPPEVVALLEGMSPDERRIAELAFRGIDSGDDATKLDIAKALEEAIKIADPIAREQIRMVQDELSRVTTNTSEDAASTIAQQEAHIAQLKKDLTFGRDQLTLEEQASLATQLREYESALQETQQTFAESGLAFSSPRQKAEQELGTKQREVAESTTRQTQRSLYALQSSADSAMADANVNIANTKRTAAYNTTAASRAAEGQLGSKNTPVIGGVTQLGGITGSIEKDRLASIASLEQLATGASAPQKFF